jgi:hypothetical protein
MVGINPGISLVPAGLTAAADMLMKEVSHNGGGNNIRFGDSFTEDQFAGETFDYFLAKRGLDRGR